MFYLCCCKNEQPTGVITTHAKQEKKDDPWIQINKKNVALENEEIDLFIKRYGWKMIKTGSGLRYQVVKKGEGAIPKQGETVQLKYKMLFLSGDEVSNSDEDGELEFVIERSGEITGLHEAVQLIPHGSKARLIIPSYLAYGIVGDGDRINGQFSLVMIIEIQ